MSVTRWSCELGARRCGSKCLFRKIHSFGRAGNSGAGICMLGIREVIIPEERNTAGGVARKDCRYGALGRSEFVVVFSAMRATWGSGSPLKVGIRASSSVGVMLLSFVTKVTKLILFAKSCGV